MNVFLLAAEQASVVHHPEKFWAYAIFLGVVVLFLALDLGVFHRNAHEVSLKEATFWSVVWVTCGLLFTVAVYFAYEGHFLGLGLDTPYYVSAAEIEAGSKLIARGEVTGGKAAEAYLVGYLVEKSLSMDNIFVIAIIFGLLKIPSKYQHRVLFWGIVGALLMRGLMIFLGTALIQQYQWLLIIFGGFLLFVSVKMALTSSESDPSKNIVVRLARLVMPVATFLDGQRFFTRRSAAPTYSPDPTTGVLKQDPAPAGSLGRLMMTPLMVALIMVEVTDLIFAVDSIPAIVAITPDPFIVFTSNIFAILGLRALYFCLAALIAKFRFLKPALILILAFVGVKLLLFSVPPYIDNIGGFFGASWAQGNPIKIDTTVSLIVVLGTLAAAVVLSVAMPGKQGTEAKH